MRRFHVFKRYPSSRDYLVEGLGQDLGARLERLQWAGDEADLLHKIEWVISAQGLVELRSKLAIILDRLETRRFEIAVFGRVSSGKSSLLDHILHIDVLPVGVNPITAVSTRLVSGPERGLTVAFADRRVERLEVTALPDFVTEKCNPTTQKASRGLWQSFRRHCRERKSCSWTRRAWALWRPPGP